MKKKLLLSFCLAVVSMAAFAQYEVPYSSSIGVRTSSNGSTGVISSEWTAIDNDPANSRAWTYFLVGSSYSPYADGYDAGVQISNKSFSSNDDWIVSPAITLEAGVTYKLSWWVQCPSSSGKTDYRAAFTPDFSKESLTPEEGQDIDELYLSTLSDNLKANDAMILTENVSGSTWTQITKTISVEESGNYRFGFHSTETTNGYNTGSLRITGFSISVDQLTPGEVTNLTATNEGEELKVTLSWSLPTVDDKGNDLTAPITGVNIYRNDELLESVEEAITTYTDESLTEPGFYTYAVSAFIRDAEGKSVSVKTNYVGPIAAMTIPYTADFSDADLVSVYWTCINGNNDDKMWKYDNSNGYFTYENENTTIKEDDWLISPKIEFTKAGIYTLTWKGKCGNGHLAFFLGTDNTVEAMTTEFAETDLTGYSTVTKTFTFAVPAAGIYYIGIHNDVNPSKGYSYQTSAFAIDYAPVVTKTITDAGYATYCSEEALDFTTTVGLTAFIAHVNNGVVTFEEVQKVPAETGVLLMGEPATYDIAIAESADAVSNDFVGVLVSTEIPVGSFVLLDDEHGVGFYKTTGTFTAGANTAYLPALDSDAKFISINGDEPIGETPTAIQTIMSLNDNGAIYNLNGQQMTSGKLSKGIYVVNGHKVLVK